MDIRLIKRDCLQVMLDMDDKSVVTIADPPYGIGRDWEKRNWRARAAYRDCRYMNRRPSREYFDEIERVSREWIIWGWNYFVDILPPTNYLIVWDKMSQQSDVFHYSKCEIAGTTYKVPCNLVSLGWDGYRMGEETGTRKIHPHQKPIALYRWLISTYLGPDVSDTTVFDPFMGSGSCAIACRNKGVGRYIGCEVEDQFFDAAVARIRAFCGPADTITVEIGEDDAKKEETDKEDGQPVQG